MLIEAFRIEGRRGQVLMIPRSCASVHCEPCQGLTAAALSRSYVVPRGSFGGDNYPCTASIRTVGIRCTALKSTTLQVIGESFFAIFCSFAIKNGTTNLFLSKLNSENKQSTVPMHILYSHDELQENARRSDALVSKTFNQLKTNHTKSLFYSQRLPQHKNKISTHKCYLSLKQAICSIFIRQKISNFSKAS